LSSLVAVAVVGATVAVVVLVDLERPQATLSQQAFLFRCLLALLALLARLPFLVAMAARPPFLASPLLAVVVVERLVALLMVDLVVLEAVVHSQTA
jgi:hypothetical protein